MPGIRVIGSCTFNARIADEPAKAVDLGTEQHLNEVTVEAVNVKSIDGGVEYTPSPKVKRAAFDAFALLKQMPLSNVKSLPDGNSFFTPGNQPYTIFMNGRKVEQWEVNLIKPGDIMAIQVLDHPVDPLYQRAEYVINIRVKVYDYGAYMLLNGTQNFFNRYNDIYQVSAKYERNRWSVSAMAAAYVNKGTSHDERTDTYRFPESDGTLNDVVKKSVSDSKYKSHNGVFALNAYYHAGNKFIWMQNFGIGAGDTPVNNASGHAGYDVREDDVPLTTATSGSSGNNSVYYSTVVAFHELPRNNYLQFGFFINYGNNRIRSLYTIGNETSSEAIDNSSRNNNINIEGSVSYYKRFANNTMLNFKVENNYSRYNNHYRGTTVEDLRRDIYTVRPSVNYAGSVKSFSYQIDAKTDITHYSSPGYKSVTTLSPRAKLIGQGKTGNTGQYEISIDYSSDDAGAFNFAGIGRQTDEISGYSPDRAAKTTHYIFSMAYYTWMITKTFNITPSLSYSTYLNDPTAIYTPHVGIMYSKLVTSGRFEEASGGLYASKSFPTTNVNVNAGVTYSYQHKYGVNPGTTNSVSITGSVSWIPIERLSVSFNAYYKTNKWTYRHGQAGGMYTSDKYRFSGTFRASYNYRSLSVILSVSNPWWARNPMTSSRNSEYYDSYSYRYSSDTFNARHVMLSLRYTLDFGKKISAPNVNYHGRTIGDR